MAINFPDSPSVNDTHTVGDKTWTWDGTVWSVVTGGIPTSISELSITNDLTVDTDTLHVDSTNNRVGIGTTSPSAELDVSAAVTPKIQLTSEKDGTWVADDPFGELNFYGSDTSGGGAGYRARILSVATDEYGYEGEIAFRTTDVNDGDAERVRIDKLGNVGIGTSSPTTALDISQVNPTLTINDTDGVAGGSIAALIQFEASNTVAGEVGFGTGAGNMISWAKDGNYYAGTQSADNVFLRTSNLDRVTIDSSGHTFFGNNIQTGQSSFTREPWAASTIALGNYGYVGTEGSYGLSLAWNYERGTDSGYYSLAVNGSSAAAGLHMRSDGIRLQYESSWGATTEPATRAFINDGGLTVYGSGTFSNSVAINDGSSDALRELTIAGGGTGYTQSDVQYIIEDGNRGGGAYTLNTSDQVTWYVGTRYGSSSALFTISSKTSSASLQRDAASSSGTSQIMAHTNGHVNLLQIYGSFTTSSAANLHITSGGWLYRSTSSGKYKTEVEDLDDYHADLIYNLRPVWYRSLSTDDPSTWSYYGLIAEEVAEVDPRLVQFGHSPDCSCPRTEDGELVDFKHESSCLTEPEGVQYDRIIPHLISVTQRQKQTIDALIARIEALEAN